MNSEDVFLVALVGLLLFWGACLYLFWGRFRLHRGSGFLRLIAGNLLILLMLLSLGLLLGEAYFRWFYNTTEAAALTKTTHRWLDRHYSRNNWGMRDDVDYRDQMPPGTRRVTFLGDSFTVGLGVPDVDDRFVNVIRSRRPDWSVHMLADYGWQTGDELANPDLNRASYELGVVLLVYCLNDAADLNDELNDYVRLLADSAPRPGFLVRHSYLLDQLFWRMLLRRLDARQYQVLMMRGYEGRIWETQQARLRSLRDVVHQRGGRLVAVTFPFLDHPWTAYPYAAVHQRLDATWEALGVPHLDLLQTFREHSPTDLVVNGRDAHPNERAHALAADAMLPLLDREFSKTVPPA